jgi:hypothetical protein
VASPGASTPTARPGDDAFAAKTATKTEISFPQVTYQNLLLGFCLRGLRARRSLIFKTGSYSMAKKATIRRAWTAEQVRTLKTMARQKKRASRIAKALKRTEGATRQKAFSIGVSLDSRA